MKNYLLSFLLCSTQLIPSILISPLDANAQVLPDTLWLDVSSPDPVFSSFELKEGSVYTLVIDGTISIWDTWGGGSCGDFMGIPRYPSPIVLNGPTGVDPAFIFSSPLESTTPFCDGPLPVPQGDFKLSTDGGQSFQVIRPLDDNYTIDHIYTYEVTGQGNMLSAILDDEPFEDNYGVFRIIVQSARPVARESDQPHAGALEVTPIYPNPVFGRATVEINVHHSEFVQLEIFDSLGRQKELLQSGMLPAGTHVYSVNTTSYSAGVYFYRVSSRTSQTTRFFLVHTF